MSGVRDAAGLGDIEVVDDPPPHPARAATNDAIVNRAARELDGVDRT
jgi:hypothetical protein